MKYKILNTIVPQNQRKDINEKILFLIENNSCSENNITNDEIMNCYTGKGKLHGLDFKDFENYYEYSERKKMEEEGQFFTPPKICKFIVDCVSPSNTDLISDLTFGMGHFFNFCPIEQNCYGTELDFPAYKVAKHLYPNANLSNEDIRLYDPKVKFDVIFGNPPFGLKWRYEKEEYLSQLFYFIKASDMMNPAGILALIVPSSFLADDFMDKKMIELVDERFNFIFQCNLPKNSFKDVGVNSFATKIMFFQKKSEHVIERKYKTEIDSVKISDTSSTEIRETYIKPVLEEKKKLHAKILLEILSGDKDDKEFQYQVKKYLFDIHNSKHTKNKYAQAFNYVNEYHTQKCPDGMKYEEWEKVKNTKNKVLSYLKKILQNQHVVERDEIKLVKDNYRLRLKAYSGKAKYRLSRMKGEKSCSFNTMVLNDNYPFVDLTYRKLLFKKIDNYQKSNIKFKDLNDSHIGEIEKHLSKSHIMDYSRGEKITLTDIQKRDTASMIYKKRGILDWEQGSGKSIGAIFWYRYFKPSVKNTFIIGPAIAIKLTWDVILTNYKEDHTVIESIKDIDNIKPGQVVLISYDMLRKYERQIKRFLKINNRKISLVCDESDEMTNHNSKRTKSVLNCFKKVEKILETTGTTTRNNINELYSQIELLYNNSINMLCECPYTYRFDTKKGELRREINDYQMQPFPARYGNGLFKSCFSPFKQTVFGIKKHNQDVYNSEHLVNLIERTIITRSFFEITGKKPAFEVVRVNQNKPEEFVYDIIINDFYKMVNYFRKTGNGRKDRMLQIIRQIQLLIKATSIPETFHEYNSSEVPGKEDAIIEKVGFFKDEKVAIGTIFKGAADKYYRKLKELYPDRPIFLIKGDTHFEKRKPVLAEFQNTKNGILVSTQQSLKSSVNIPKCNKILIEALPWNMPKLSQYYMRFVRFDSDIDNKEIFFFVYKNSIEMNLLALLMDKQRLNDFIKNCDFREREDIFEEYGIDFGLIESIMEKVHDKEEKKVKIAWGKQQIS